LKQFLKFRTIKKHLNHWAQYWAENRPEATAHGHGGLPRAVGLNSREAADGGSTAAMCCGQAPVGSRGRAEQADWSKGAPEWWVNGEATQTASSGGVQWRRGRSSGRRRGWLGPEVRGRPEGEEAAVS
jgi:hypothetical protein